MEMISNKVLFTSFSGEVLAIICAFILTGKSDYFWILVAVLAVVTVLTFCKCISRINQFIFSLKDEISLDLNTLTQNIESACNDTAKEMNGAIDLFTKKYEHALEKMTSCQMTQVEEWKAGTAEIINHSNASVSTLISNVEEKILKNSDLAKKALEENILETKAAVSAIVADSKDLLQKQYVRLEELNNTLSVNTKEYARQLMDQILAVSSNNIDKMKLSCENVLNITAERIVSENEETGNKRTEAFENSLKELENTYNSIISAHIKVLEEQIVDSITMFMAENKSALMANNEMASELISSERVFVSEIENNNTKLRETITGAFEEYSKSVERNITDIKNVIEQGINAGSQNAIESINSLSKVNSETVNQFADELKIYSDNLNILSDNHLGSLDDHMKSKIQNMVEQLRTLNIENATMFSDAMSEYREKFVEASARAIAQVQVDNVSAITDANKKVSELALNLKKFQEDIPKTLTILQGIITDGVNEQKGQDEDFHSAMNELADEKLSEYNSKLQEYNDYIETLGKKITEVMDACHNNTTKYEDTLKVIIEAQREANSLNNKDVELLKTFMKR